MDKNQLNIWNGLYQFYAETLPDYNWGPAASNIHVLSDSYIIQEDAKSGLLYSLGLTPIKPPMVILNRSSYISNYPNNNKVNPRGV